MPPDEERSLQPGPSATRKPGPKTKLRPSSHAPDFHAAFETVVSVDTPPDAASKVTTAFCPATWTRPPAPRQQRESRTTLPAARADSSPPSTQRWSCPSSEEPFPTTSTSVSLTGHRSTHWMVTLPLSSVVQFPAEVQSTSHHPRREAVAKKRRPPGPAPKATTWLTPRATCSTKPAPLVKRKS